VHDEGAVTGVLGDEMQGTDDVSRGRVTEGTRPEDWRDLGAAVALPHGVTDGAQV
jgi:hypothetical protein